MDNFNCKLNGEWWMITAKQLERTDLGEADYHEKTITVDSSLVGDKRFTTAVHEAIHAVYPYLVEAEVERGGNELAEFVRLLLQEEENV